MTPPPMKRFYRDVSVVPVTGGFSVRLDQHQLSTPSKAQLTLPSAALAEAIAEEWRSQGERLAPATMPLTKLANTAIDRVAMFRDDVIAQLLAFGRSDVVCYRASAPQDLVTRQHAAWDPILEWLGDNFGARLAVAEGIAFIAQDEARIGAMRAPLLEADSFRLTALLNAAGILGSLALTLAWNSGFLTADAAFEVAHLDEKFQAERWGMDAEATKKMREKHFEIMTLDRFLQLRTACELGKNRWL